MYLGNKYGLIDQMNVDAVKVFTSDLYVSQNHLAPSQENVNILKYFKLPIVVHIRDPRQAMLSWIHHIDRITGGDANAEWVLYTIPRVPQNYFSYTLTEKITWHIKHYLPQLIDWIQRWSQLSESRELDILITDWSELRHDESALIARILEYYGIDKTKFEQTVVPKDIETSHYRKADANEWMEEYSRSQILTSTRMIPKWMLNRFNWLGCKNNPLRVKKRFWLF